MRPCSALRIGCSARGRWGRRLFGTAAACALRSRGSANTLTCWIAFYPPPARAFVKRDLSPRSARSCALASTKHQDPRRPVVRRWINLQPITLALSPQKARVTCRQHPSRKRQPCGPSPAIHRLAHRTYELLTFAATVEAVKLLTWRNAGSEISCSALNHILSFRGGKCSRFT